MAFGDDDSTTSTTPKRPQGFGGLMPPAPQGQSDFTAADTGSAAPQPSPAPQAPQAASPDDQSLNDYRQTQQANVHQGGFKALMMKALPIVQALGSGVAAAYGNPLPAEMVMRQQAQQAAAKRQAGIDQQVEQERQLQIANLGFDLQKKKDEARLNPPQSPADVMKANLWYQQQLTDMKRTAEEPKTFTTADGHLYFQPKPGQTATPVMVPPPAPVNVNQIPGQAPSVQGPASPQQQSDFLKTAQPVPAIGAPVRGEVTPEDIFKANATAQNDQARNLLTQLGLNQHREEFDENKSKQDQARLDRSFQYNSGRLDKLGAPLDQLNTRIGRLNDTIAQQSPQADALMAPELLSIMAGGAGSGLRMNEAEISRIVGGKSAWEDLKSNINHWNANPKNARSILRAQDAQIKALVSAVQAKLQSKQAILEDARGRLIASDDVQEHRRIIMETQKKLNDIDEGVQEKSQDKQSNPQQQNASPQFNYDKQGNQQAPGPATQGPG